MENLIYSMADMVSVMKTIMPLELWIIILGGITSFLIMEYSDRKRLRHLRQEFLRTKIKR